MHERITARLTLLRQEQEQESQQYAVLEQQLGLLRRNLDMRYGAMQELEALLPDGTHDTSDEDHAGASELGSAVSHAGAAQCEVPGVAPAVAGAE